MRLIPNIKLGAELTNRENQFSTIESTRILDFKLTVPARVPQATNANKNQDGRLQPHDAARA